MLDPEGHRQKTAHNRKASAEYLNRFGISFEERNGGAHLIVSHGPRTVDFWPGTGLWIVRVFCRHGRGVRNLVNEFMRPWSEK
jgi:hypothetical protein